MSNNQTVPVMSIAEANALLTAPDGRFPMKQIVVNGEEYSVFEGLPETFADLFAATAKYAGREYLVYEDERVTFDAFRRVAAALARHLAGQGVNKGDRVAIVMRNLPEWFIAYYGAALAGAIVTPLNGWWTGPELEFALVDSGASVAIVDDRQMASILPHLNACPALKRVLVTRHEGPLPADSRLFRLEDVIGVPNAWSGLPEAHLPQVDFVPDEPVSILYTSGTTGRPKGATLTHRNICSVARDMEMRAEAGLIQAAEQAGMDVEALRTAMPPPAPVLLISPMFHISGIVGMLLPLHVGCANILMRRWDAVKALDIIEARGVANLSGPSLVFSDLLALPDGARRMRTLRSCAVAGQATPARLAEELREGVPQIGVSSCWGQTECTGAATTGSGALFAAFPGTVGPRVPYVDIRVVDAEGNELPCGEVGELLVRGPTVMCGYWGDEKATAEALRDGWLHTGDLGRIDEQGLIYIDDRAKDMVIAGGQNIYCAEVERVLSMMHEQQEVALFGVPDERLGERAIAAVTLKAEAVGAIDEAAVKSHVRAHLASYKVPLEVRFDLGPFPRNDLGKINKAQLVQRYFELAPANIS